MMGLLPERHVNKERMFVVQCIAITVLQSFCEGQRWQLFHRYGCPGLLILRYLFVGVLVIPPFDAESFRFRCRRRWRPYRRELADGDLRVWTDRSFWSTHKEPPAKTRSEVINFQRKQFVVQRRSKLLATCNRDLLPRFVTRRRPFLRNSARLKGQFVFSSSNFTTSPRNFLISSLSGASFSARLVRKSASPPAPRASSASLPCLSA